VLGIPDFRVFLDSYIDYEEDYEKAKFLANQADRLDFRELIRLYWTITPEVSEVLSKRFIKRIFVLVHKGIDNLKEIEEISRKHYRNRMGLDAVLEIGCGTGGFLAAAKEFASPPLEWLREEVKSERFILRKRIPIRSNSYELQDVALAIYEYKEYTPPKPGNMLQMNIPLMGDSVAVQFDDLLHKNIR